MGALTVSNVNSLVVFKVLFAVSGQLQSFIVHLLKAKCCLHYKTPLCCRFAHSSPYLTEVAQLVRLSSGSGCSATCCLCDARHAFPLTGWILAGPDHQQTESGGYKQCRPRPRRSSGHEGSRWWCGWAYCSLPKLKKTGKNNIRINE